MGDWRQNVKDDHSPGRGPASLHLPASQTEGSHLAHWPPPQRGQETKPVIMTHQPGEPKRCGWLLTRAHFSKFKDDE